MTNNIFDQMINEIKEIDNYATVNGHDIWVRTPDEIKKDIIEIIEKYKLEYSKNN